MRGTGLGIVVLCASLVLACGKGSKDDKPAEGTPPAAAPAAAGGTPTAAGGTAPAPTAAGTPAPAPAASAAACQAACDHRKSCNVPNGDVARCVEDCTMLSDQLRAEDLEAYAKADCAEVTKGDSNFQALALCRRACRHRSECIPEADATSCEAECVGLVLATGQEPAAILEPYIAADCAGVKSEEAGFQLSGSCLRACGKAIECGVRDSAPACLTECAQAIQGGKATAEAMRALATQTCEQVKAQVPPLPKPAPRPAASGLSGKGCLSNGAQDCPHFSVCCRNSDYTRPGSGPGHCISPAICLMPTR